MLVEHRIDDVDEGFVAGEKAMSAREQISFEPSFALVLAQDLHHPAVRRNMVVAGNYFRGRTTVGHLEYRTPAVRRRFVRTENAEGFGVQFDHVADQFALDARSFRTHATGFRNLHRVVSEIRKVQVAQ